MSKGQRSRYLDRMTTRNQQQSLRKQKRTMRMEPLEERHLLAADIDIPGSLIERTELTDAINNVGETDTFILSLDAQQTLSVAIDANGSLAPEVEVLDAGGNTIGADTGAAGGSASLHNLEIATAGTYVIFVRGGTSTGTYSGSYAINSDIEVESVGDDSNDTVGSAQNLDDAFETGPGRGAVIGSFVAGDTVDYYRVPAGADANAIATIGVRADDEGIGLELVDASGATVAVSLSAGNFDQVIDGYSNAGELFVKVDRGEASVGTAYTLLISPETGFEVESNGSIPDANPAQDLVAGGVTVSAFSGTRLVTEFAGMDSNDTTCNCEPPDTHGIAGPNHVLEVVNTAVAVYNKDGSIAMPPMEITDFFDPSIIAGELFDFDPVVAYDEIEERWVLVILSGATAGAAETDILYAISDTSDPTGPWTEQHRIDMAGIAPGEFADYPKIGWNADSHIVSVNMFFSNVRTNIISIDKSTVLDANPATFGVQITDLGPTSFTTTVATMHDSEPGDPMWFVEEASYNDGNTLRILKMDDTNSPTPTYTRYLLDVDPYDPPAPAAQPGGSFRTNDARLLNAEMRDDRLVATHAVGLGGRSIARWYEFDVSSGTPQLTQQANIDPGPGIHTFFPSIAINERGDIGVTYMQSSSSEFVSMYVTGQAAGSELNSMAPPVLVQAGNEFYAGGRGGDYSGVGVDPVTDSFWAFNEVSLNGPAPNPLWSTWIGEFEIAPNEDQDFYALDMVAGETVMLETSTPYDAPGNVVNDLDPVIEIYDEAGVLLAMDDNSAADGKNAMLSFTAPSAGSYRALVRGANETLGAYVLDVDGITFANDPPVVVGANPVDGLTLGAFPTTVRFDFSEPINLSSVSASDFQIGGVEATSFDFTDGDSVVLGVDPAANQGDGVYTISIAADAVDDYSGLGNLPYSSTFAVDTTGPRVLATSWNGAAIPSDLTFNPGPLTFTASFNEDLFALASPRRGLRTPGIDDIRLTETVSGNEISALSVAYDEDLEIFTADFPDLAEGNYELRLISGDGAFEDEIGNDLDGEPTLGNLDGTPTGNGVPGGDYAIAFSVDVNGVFTDINPFERQMPLGSLMSSSRGNEGAISSPSDTDAYTVFVEEDSTLGGIVTPNDTNAVMSVEVLGQSFTAPGPGLPVVFFPVTASIDGFEEITFSSTSATGYTVDLYRNANVDSLAEALGPIAMDATELVSTQDVYNAVGRTTGSLGGIVFEQYNDPTLFVNIAATGNALGLGDDDTANITTTVDSDFLPAGPITISNNGAIVAGTSQFVDFTNGTLPNVGWGTALTPFWDDIDSERGDVYWEERIVDGKETFIVQWNGRPHFSGIGTATFQLQVFEGSFGVRYAYRDVNFGDSLYDAGASATIGYQESSGQATMVSFDSPILSNGDVIDFVREVASIDVDEFTFEADAGQSIDVTLNGYQRPLSNELLELVDPNGIVVATGVSAGNDLEIIGHIAADGGTYSAKVSTSTTSEFVLTTTTDRRIETGLTREVSTDVGAIGFLGTSTSFDFIQASNPAGFIDISASGTFLELGDDDETTITTTIGNSFFPAGPVTVANNGGIIAGAGGNLNAGNGALPNAGFGTALLPFWDDIDSDSGGVYWDEVDVNGIPTLIVQWDDRPHFSNVGAATFQVQVPSTGPIARFAYEDVIFGQTSFDRGISATVGVQQSVSSAATFSRNLPTLNNGDVITVTSLDQDSYEINLAQGEEVVISTETPLNNPSHDPLSSVDPAIDVLNSQGLIVASDDNSAGDGVNARLAFTAPAAGTYLINVIAMQGSGEYLLNIDTTGGGDFNGDGILDCSDIDALTTAVASSSTDLTFDVNGDSVVDFEDVSTWVEDLYGTLPGDVNLDFVVDVSDFAIWNANKFTTGTAWCTGDLNADGVTDVLDFNIWNQDKFMSALRSVAGNSVVNLDSVIMRPRVAFTTDMSRESTDVVLANWRSDSLVDENTRVRRKVDDVVTSVFFNEEESLNWKS